MTFNRFTTYAVIVSFLLGGLACTITDSLMVSGASRLEISTIGQVLSSTSEGMACCSGMRSNIAGFVHHLGQEADAAVVSGVHADSELLTSFERVSESSIMATLTLATLATFIYTVLLRRRYGGDKVFVYLDSLFSQGILNPKLF